MIRLESITRSWKSVKKNYRKARRKYIEFKKWAKQKLRIPFYPFYAVRFVLEQISQGHLPSLDWNLFLMDSWLERRLYYQIRNKYKGKIIPQYHLRPYWIDLALPDYKLAIELDGYKYHSKRKEHDRRRDAYMYRQGWKVMRFSYKEIQKEMPRVLSKIEEYTSRIDQKNQPPQIKKPVLVEKEIKKPIAVEKEITSETQVPSFLKKHIKRLNLPNPE